MALHQLAGSEGVSMFSSLNDLRWSLVVWTATFVASVAAAGCAQNHDDLDDAEDASADGKTDGADARAPAALDSCGDGKSLEQLWEVDNGHGPIVAMATKPDGTVIVSADDGAVTRWSVGRRVSTRPRSRLALNLDRGPTVRSLAIRGNTVVGGDESGALRVWSLRGGDSSRFEVLDVSVDAVAVLPSPTRALVAHSYLHGHAHTVDPASGSSNQAFSTELWGITSFAVNGDTLFVGGQWYNQGVGVERRSLSDISAKPTSWIATGPEYGNGMDIDVSADRARVASTGINALVVLDAEQIGAGPIARVSIAGYRGRAVTFTRSGDYVIDADDSGTITLRNRDLSHVIDQVSVGASVSAVAIDDSGSRLLVASDDGYLRAFTCR